MYASNVTSVCQIWTHLCNQQIWSWCLGRWLPLLLLLKRLETILLFWRYINKIEVNWIELCDSMCSILKNTEWTRLKKLYKRSAFGTLSFETDVLMRCWPPVLSYSWTACGWSFNGYKGCGRLGVGSSKSLLRHCTWRWAAQERVGLT